MISFHRCGPRKEIDFRENVFLVKGFENLMPVALVPYLFSFIENNLLKTLGIAAAK